MAAEAQIKITIDSKQANQSVEKLQADLKATREELTRVIKTYGENSKQADTLRKSLAGLEVEMGKLGVATDEVITSQASLKQQLRQTITELQGLEPGSARFVELSQRAGELRDRIADTNQVVNALAGNTAEKLGKAFQGIAQIGVAGFQAVYSSMTLLGFEGEDLQKTMTTLMAVMNFSQAITTLGGIPDTFTSIKTAVTGLIPSLGAAKTASSTLGSAMSSIPILAVVGAIGALVVGVNEYMKSSSKAAEKDKERQKELEKLKKQKEANKKAQEEERSSVAASSKEYIGLILQLKSTNANSKERQKQINEINATYGTTLQNISDEAKFTEQLNKSIRDYVALQVIKVRQEKNVGKIAESIQKEDEARIAYEKSLRRAQKQADLFNITLKEYLATSDDAAIQTNKLQAAYVRQQLVTGDLTLSTEELVKEEQKLTNGGTTYVKKTKEKTDATIDYSDALERVKKELDRINQTQEINDKLDAERVKNSLERDINSINEKYGDTRQQIIDTAIQGEIDALDKQFKEGTLKLEEGKTREETYKEKLKEINTNYQNFLTDGEKTLLDKIETYRQEDITNLEKTYSQKEQIVLKQTEQIGVNSRLLELQFNKKNELEDIDNAEITEEKKREKRLEVLKKYADIEIGLLQEQANKEKQILDLQLQQTLSDTTKTNAEKEQAQADYNNKVKSLQMKLADDIDAINDGVEELIPTKAEAQKQKLEKIQQYADKIVEIYSQLSDVVGSFIDERNAREEAAIRESFDNQQKILDEQLENRIISEEQYNYEKERLDADREAKETEQRRKAFESSKKLQLVNATIQGAQAVLNAFSSGMATPILGPATAAIYAGIAAAFSAAQIAQIATQQFTAAEGGIVPGNGSGDIDSVPSLLAPGEFVINSTSSSMFPNLLSQINEAGGGKKLVPDALPSMTSQTTPNVFVNGGMGNNEPIKAYVVETDISESQRRINRIKQSVEF